MLASLAAACAACDNDHKDPLLLIGILACYDQKFVPYCCLSVLSDASRKVTICIRVDFVNCEVEVQLRSIFVHRLLQK